MSNAFIYIFSAKQQYKLRVNLSNNDNSKVKKKKNQQHNPQHPQHNPQHNSIELSDIIR